MWGLLNLQASLPETISCTDYSVSQRAHRSAKHPNMTFLYFWLWSSITHLFLHVNFWIPATTHTCSPEHDSNSDSRWFFSQIEDGQTNTVSGKVSFDRYDDFIRNVSLLLLIWHFIPLSHRRRPLQSTARPSRMSWGSVTVILRGPYKIHPHSAWGSMARWHSSMDLLS